MAINPSVEYPSKTTSPDASYPYGGARNVTSPGDGTGTPWRANIINDLFGFQQAILSEAAVSPSGSAETAQASQYLEGLKSIMRVVAREPAIQQTGRAFAHFVNGALTQSWPSVDGVAITALTQSIPGNLTATVTGLVNSPQHATSNFTGYNGGVPTNVHVEPTGAILNGETFASVIERTTGGAYTGIPSQMWVEVTYDRLTDLV